jgi:surfeit locus 1 family protein
MMRNYYFVRPRPVPLIITIGACLLLFSLGVWQVQRLHWKEALLARIEYSFTHDPLPISEYLGARAPEEFMRVRFAIGQILPQEYHIAAKYYRTKLGYHMVVPVILQPSTAREQSKPVLAFVNMGWIPAGLKHASREPVYRQLTGREFTGMLRKPRKKIWVLPDNKPGENLWFWYDLNAMQAGLPKVYAQMRVFPYVIDLLEPEKTPLPEDAPIPFSPKSIHIRNDHLSYAVTWFSTGLACLVIFVLYHMRKREADDPTVR